MTKSEIEKRPEFEVASELVRRMEDLPADREHHQVVYLEYTLRRCSRRQTNVVINGETFKQRHQITGGVMVGVNGKESRLDYRWNVYRIACLIHRNCAIVE